MSKLMLAGMFFVATSAFAETEPTKIGYVDMQKAIQTTKAGQKAKKDLESEYNVKKKELEVKDKDLKKMGDDLEKKAMVLSDEVKGKKQMELKEEMLRFQEVVAKSQLSIQQKERDLTKPILEKLRKIIGDIGEKEKYTVILERSENSVLWAPEKIDLTDRIIKEFDKN